MRILVLADIHHRYVRAQSIIEKVKHDRCVLLGDYFDNYSDEDIEAANTAKWLLNFVLPNKNIVPLIGNHDQMYFYKDNINLRCSGYSNPKNDMINRVLSPDHKKQFKFYHIEEGYLFIHAGLTNGLWKEISKDFEIKQGESKAEYVDRVLGHNVVLNDKLASSNKDASLFAAGWDRGGFHRHGGINWVDWFSFSPVKGINQIVGHTRHRIPQVLLQHNSGGITGGDVNEFYKKLDTKNYSSINYAMDTDTNHYAIIENGVAEFFDATHHINLREANDMNIPESEMHGLL
jgi:hypothetical protein